MREGGEEKGECEKGGRERWRRGEENGECERGREGGECEKGGREGWREGGEEEGEHEREREGGMKGWSGRSDRKERQVLKVSEYIAAPLATQYTPVYQPMECCYKPRAEQQCQCTDFAGVSPQTQCVCVCECVCVCVVCVCVELTNLVIELPPLIL